MIRYILFDLGKVILNFNHYRISERLTKYSAFPKAKIHRVIFKTPKEIAFEKGKLSPKVFYSFIKNSLKLKLTYSEFLPLWNDIFWPKPGMAALTAKLGKKYPLGMLSNTNKLHFDYVKKKYPVISRFDDYYLSYKLGLRKPDSKIYKAVLKRTGLKPEEIVYFDDIPEYVRAAKKLGINAFVMKTAAECGKIIRKLQNV